MNGILNTSIGISNLCFRSFIKLSRIYLELLTALFEGSAITGRSKNINIKYSISTTAETMIVCKLFFYTIVIIYESKGIKDHPDSRQPG